jgi:hypothetical protein
LVRGSPPWSGCALLLFYGTATQSFHLYAYDEIFAVPLGTKVLDARLVLFVDRIFRDRNGSYSGFSNFFRYKLLLDVGGWWVDLDLHRSPPSQITGGTPVSPWLSFSGAGQLYESR